MIVRPDAVVMPDGSIASGLEVCISNGIIEQVRPWSTAERDEVGMLLSPAFVNAHSHLEYFDLLGKMPDLDYWPWIRELTRLKPSRSLEVVQQAAIEAAFQNVACGITTLGEWSDWPVSANAMAAAGLRGRLYQEVITLAEPEGEGTRLAQATVRAMEATELSGIPAHPTPHASYTASTTILRQSAESNSPQSIHVCESEHEDEFFEHGTGKIAELYRMFDVSFESPGLRTIVFLDSLGAIRPNTQLVHCCTLTHDEVELIASRGATVAHCPRSNRALGCLPAPIKQMLRSGIVAGLGLDSAASSGVIDMFAEMRAAIASAALLEDPLTSAEVWNMATEGACKSISVDRNWRIEPGGNPDLVLLKTRGDLSDQIAHGKPDDVVDVIRL
ncbi:MAG: amidohydrolase family protein [Fimbriimonadales bacterium]